MVEVRLSEEYENIGKYPLIMTYLGKNIDNKFFWDEYGITNFSMKLDVVLQMCGFIQEKDFEGNGECTQEDLTAFLLVVFKERYQIPINEEKCLKLVQLILDSVLGNNGKPMYYQPNFLDENRTSSFRYIENKAADSRSGRRVISTYKLNTEFSIALLSLKESERKESKVQIMLGELLVKMSIEKKDYKGALDAVKGIFTEMKNQINLIEQKQKEFLGDMSVYSPQDYEDLTKGTLDLLKETATNLKGYQVNFERQLHDLEDTSYYSPDDHLGMSDKDESFIEKVNYLKRTLILLDRSISAQSDLMRTHQAFKEKQEKILTDLMTQLFGKNINLKEEVLNPILSDSQKIGDLATFFMPLFKKPVPKHYNLGVRLFSGHHFGEDDEVAGFNESEVIDTEKVKEAERLAEKAHYDRHKQVIEGILTVILSSESNRITYQDLVNNLIGNDALYKQTLGDKKGFIFRNTFLKLIQETSVMDIIPLNQLPEDETDDEYYGSFNTDKLLRTLGEENESFKGVKHLYAKTHMDDRTVRLEDIEFDDGTMRDIIMPDMDIWIEKENYYVD